MSLLIFQISNQNHNLSLTLNKSCERLSKTRKEGYIVCTLYIEDYRFSEWRDSLSLHPTYSICTGTDPHGGSWHEYNTCGGHALIGNMWLYKHHTCVISSVNFDWNAFQSGLELGR